MAQTIEEAVTELIQKVSQLETKVAKLERTGALDEIQAEKVKAVISELEGTSELVTTQAEETKTRISALEWKIQNQGDEGKGRSLLESKIVTSQAKFGGERKAFREWSDKMKNALGSTRTSFRDVFKWIEDRMPTSETSPNYYEYKKWMEYQWKDPISDRS